MNITEVQDSLQNLINTKISLAEIGNILGVSRASISQRAKVGRDMKREELKLIGDHFNVDLMPNSLVIDNKPEETFKMDYYPDIFGSCGNGVFELSQEKDQIIVPKKAFFEKFSPNKQYSVINAYGNSMQPLIYDRDKLIVEHWNGEQIIDNRPYIFCYKNEIFIKRLVKNINQLMIIPENKDYDVIKLNEKEMNNVQVIGQIVGLMRDLR